MLIEKES